MQRTLRRLASKGGFSNLVAKSQGKDSMRSILSQSRVEQRKYVIAHSNERSANSRLQEHVYKFIVKKRVRPPRLPVPPCLLLSHTEQRAQVIEALGFEFKAAAFQTMLAQKRIHRDSILLHGQSNSVRLNATLDDVIHTSGNAAGVKRDTAFKLLERQRGVEVEIAPEEMMLYFQNWYIGMTTALDHGSLIFWLVFFSLYLYLESYDEGRALLEIFFVNHHDANSGIDGMQMRDPKTIIVTEPEL